MTTNHLREPDNADQSPKSRTLLAVHLQSGAPRPSNVPIAIPPPPNGAAYPRFPTRAHRAASSHAARPILKGTRVPAGPATTELTLYIYPILRGMILSARRNRKFLRYDSRGLRRGTHPRNLAGPPG